MYKNGQGVLQLEFEKKKKRKKKEEEEEEGEEEKEEDLKKDCVCPHRELIISANLQ